MKKEKTNGLQAIEELRKSFDYQTWVLSRLDIIENELKEYEGAKAHIEALTKEKLDTDYAIHILSQLIDFKIDLRDETQASFIQTKEICQTISYEKATLLKKIFGK